LSILEFFWSMSDVGWAALLTDVTTSEIRGRIVGALNFIASLGRMVGIVFVGFLYANGEGFKNGTIFFVVTILLFIGAAIMTLISRRIKWSSDVPKHSITREAEQREDRTVDVNEKRYRWFLAFLIIVVLGAASINQIFLLFIRKGLNVGDSEMGLILSAWTIGGMLASITSGRLADKIGKSKVIFFGLILAIVTPLLYSAAPNVSSMALIYGSNGASFWILQTVGFAFAGDMVPGHKRGRLLSRYNTVMALSWGPAGILIGGPLVDIQVKGFQMPIYLACVNAFYASSIIVTLGTMLFAIKFAKIKGQNNV